MNLYVINDVLYDYTPGMVVIAAPDLNRCRELFAEHFECNQSDYQIQVYDDAISSGSYKVLEVMNQQEGIVSYVYGGG